MTETIKGEPQTETRKEGVAALLEERGARYGEFADHARVSMQLKDVLGSRLVEREISLTYDQVEALHMICHKLGRIVNGDPDYIDSWDDIAGYATLVADRLRRGQ